MFSIITDLDTVERYDSLELSVTSVGTAALVVDWLNQLLYVYEADEFLPIEHRVSTDEAGKSLFATCADKRLDPKKRDMRTAVKAATYHDLEVSHARQWRIQVVLDV